MKVSDHLMSKVEENKKRIGELLLQHTALTNIQLEEALAQLRLIRQLRG